MNIEIPKEISDTIEKMLKRSQTKVLFPVITLAIIKFFLKTGKSILTDLEIRGVYQTTVQELKRYLGHDFHIGGLYYDAYSSRNLPQYNVIKPVGEKKYQIDVNYQKYAKEIVAWLPEKIKVFIDGKLGAVATLGSPNTRVNISLNNNKFTEIITSHISNNATNFEIFGFAIIKVHLEKFACRIYRDTKTSSHDAGVDLSTDFGVVYQMKKLKVTNLSAAKNIYSELKANFDRERIDDGRVVLIIDEITKDIQQYLVNMKVQSINTNDLLNLAKQFQDSEDREKVLRIIYDEFRREYASVI